MKSLILLAGILFFVSVGLADDSDPSSLDEPVFSAEEQPSSNSVTMASENVQVPDDHLNKKDITPPPPEIIDDHFQQDQNNSGGQSNTRKYKARLRVGNQHKKVHKKVAVKKSKKQKVASRNISKKHKQKESAMLAHNTKKTKKIGRWVCSPEGAG